MKLWEITAATTYFPGLKRTYKLALRIQRRLVGPQHPRARTFLHRRTRSIFESVHKNIQERDIEVGRNVENWILRWLDHMKPSAEIRLHPPASNSNLLKHVTGSGLPPGTHRPNIKITNQESNSRQLFTTLNIRTKFFPTIPMMLQSRKPVGMSSQCRHFGSVFPSDIPQLMLHN